MSNIEKWKYETSKENTSTLATKMEEYLLQVLAGQTADEVLALAKTKIDKYVTESYGVIPKKIIVENDGAAVEMQGIFHEKFESVLQLVKLQIPVFLSGEAGTGKNVICKQIAEALGLEFYFTNAVTQEFQLKGFTDAHGQYHETQFFKAFKNGGLFFLDEMDASVPEALIILNGAIANGYFDFPAPIGRVEAHENFYVIAAGNTTGTGADIEYTGRFQLDAASLDRFSLLEIGYSPLIELFVTNGNVALCEFAREFRKITAFSSMKCLFSYRSLERINKMEKFFDELSEVLKMALIKGLGIDDLQIICNQFRENNFSNKYTTALEKLSNDENR